MNGNVECNNLNFIRFTIIMMISKNPVKSSLFIPAVVVQYALLEVKENLVFLKRRQEEVSIQENPDDWPDDYDPNDIALYECLLPNLQEGLKDGYGEEYWWGKPFAWLMIDLRGMLKRKSNIPIEDKLLIAKTLCEYYLKKSFWHVLDNPCIDLSRSADDLEKEKVWVEEHYTKEIMKLIVILTNESM